MSGTLTPPATAVPPTTTNAVATAAAATDTQAHSTAANGQQDLMSRLAAFLGPMAPLTNALPVQQTSALNLFPFSCTVAAVDANPGTAPTTFDLTADAGFRLNTRSFASATIAARGPSLFGEAPYVELLFVPYVAAQLQWYVSAAIVPELATAPTTWDGLMNRPGAVHAQGSQGAGGPVGTAGSLMGPYSSGPASLRVYLPPSCTPDVYPQALPAFKWKLYYFVGHSGRTAPAAATTWGALFLRCTLARSGTGYGVYS